MGSRKDGIAETKECMTDHETQTLTSIQESCSPTQFEEEDRKATKEPQTPTGFYPEAQGKRSAALGCGTATIPTPTGLYKETSIAARPCRDLRTHRFLY